MRKAMLAFAILLVAGSMGWAAGPPTRGRGDFWGTMGRQVEDSDIFDTARRRLVLTTEQQAALQKLDGIHDAEERAAIKALQAEFDKKYVALIIEIAPGEEKAKFQKVFDAMVARDALVDAAKKEILEVLTKLEADETVESQRDPDYIPSGKTDIMRRFIKLSEPQQKTLDDARRASFTTLREKMRKVQRPQDWRDTEARLKYGLAVRKLRDEIDDSTAETMVALLTDAQGKAYHTAAEALDAYNKKVKAAEAAYKTTLAALGVRGATPPAAAKGDF